MLLPFINKLKKHFLIKSISILNYILNSKSFKVASPIVSYILSYTQ